MAEREALAGMGAIITDGGVAFRVWAPHADSVAVTGDFNEWSITADPLGDEGNGFWYGFVRGRHGRAGVQVPPHQR